MEEIVFENKSNDLILARDNEEIVFENKSLDLVFEVIQPGPGGGFPYILPYLLS